MPTRSRTRPLLLAAALGALLAMAPGASARADLGGVAGALVLPRAVLARVDAADPAHLGWSLTLAPPDARAAPRMLGADVPTVPAADHVLNVVRLFGRGMDVGLLAPGELGRDQLLFQLRTNLGRRRVLVRCIVRFS